MELQQRYKTHLEAIQEESEKDETRGSKTSESEESCQAPVGADTEEAMEEEESEEEEELRVLRPRRLSRSPSQSGSVQMRGTESHQEETHSSSDLSSCAEDLSDEAVTPGESMLGKETQFSPRDWKIKISKLSWEKHTPSKPSVKRRRTKRKSAYSQKNISKAEPFPRWVVNLMVNIEEATTHQLVVE